MGAKDSTPWPSGLWQRKVESPPRLGLGTILGPLGQSLTYMGPHTRLWVRSLDTVWEGVRHPRSPGLWANFHYVLLGHIQLKSLLNKTYNMLKITSQYKRKQIKHSQTYTKKEKITIKSHT